MTSLVTLIMGLCMHNPDRQWCEARVQWCAQQGTQTQTEQHHQAITCWLRYYSGEY
jgi:hypothetical protein